MSKKCSIPCITAMSSNCTSNQMSVLKQPSNAVRLSSCVPSGMDKSSPPRLPSFAQMLQNLEMFTNQVATGNYSTKSSTRQMQSAHSTSAPSPCLPSHSPIAHCLTMTPTAQHPDVHGMPLPSTHGKHQAFTRVARFLNNRGELCACLENLTDNLWPANGTSHFDSSFNEKHFTQWFLDISDDTYINLENDLNEFTNQLQILRNWKQRLLHANTTKFAALSQTPRSVEITAPWSTPKCDQSQAANADSMLMSNDVRNLSSSLHSPSSSSSISSSPPPTTASHASSPTPTAISHTPKEERQPLQKVKSTTDNFTPKAIKKRGRRSRIVTHNCKHCNSRDTPEWRKGPDGSRTLCNACGLFYSKLIKKYGTADAKVVLQYRKSNHQVMDRILPSAGVVMEIVSKVSGARE